MTDTVGSELKFEYDETQGYDWNFEKWLRCPIRS